MKCPLGLSITINLYFKGQNTLKNLCSLAPKHVGEWKESRYPCLHTSLHRNTAATMYQLVEKGLAGHP